jgi:pectin methylesterase-like acyl-CoA thioesterase
MASWLCDGTQAYAVVRMTVGPAAQGGQYATIQEAVDAVAGTTTTPNTVRHVIDVLPGTYTGRVKVPAHKPFITLRGLGQTSGDTVVTFNETQNTPPNENTNHATVVLLGKDFVAQNLTFANSYGPGVQALAMHARGDRLIFDDVRFLGWQDTLRSESGRHYFHNVYVEGSVDFIYGKGTAYFEDSTLYAKAGGYFTAQGREAAGETSGFVFNNVTVTGSAANGSVFLGRPWGAYSRSIFIDSKLSTIVPAAGWSTWSGNNHLTSYFAEYQSKDLNGNLLNVSQRASWSHQLSAAETALYTKAVWLGGTDNWNPVAPSSVDFNGDGVVNDDDLEAWRAGFAMSAGGHIALGDANGDGAVNGSDFLAWQRELSSTNSIAAVPEPRAEMLVIAAILGIGWRGRQMRAVEFEASFSDR